MTKARDIATSEVVTGEIGSTIQAHDDDLDSIAALDKTDGNVIVGDGTNWVAESGATARTSLGLGSAATTDSTDYATAAQGALADTSLQPSDIGTSVLSPTGDGSGLTGIAGGFSNMEVFTSPGTWTNPGNVNKVKVTVVGGGGGGYFTPEPTGAYSGGAGGTAIEVIPFPTATNVAVTRGAGGNQASGGGTSSFGSYCSATGGGAGKYPGNNPAQALPAGGSGSGGGINISGSGGQGVVAVSGRYGLLGGQSTFGGGYGAGGEVGKEVPVNVVGQPGVIIVEY